MSKETKQRDRARQTLDYIYLPPNPNGLLLSEVKNMVRNHCLWSHKMSCYFYTKADIPSGVHNFYRVDRNFFLYLDKKVKETIIEKRKVTQTQWGPAQVKRTLEKLENGNWLDRFATYYTCPIDEFVKLQFKEKLTRKFDFRVRIEVGEDEEGKEFYYASIKKKEDK